MTFLRLAQRSATYYWRTNLAVLLGVAAAVAVLGGALLVGDSVRGSLSDIALGRLGNADVAISSANFFQESTAERLRAALNSPSVPLIVASGFVTHEASGKRAGNVTVYGVDDRFWGFHGLPAPADVAASPALVFELGAAAGDTFLVRLQRPSEIPIDSLFANKDDIGRTVRLTLGERLPREKLGEFSLKPQQTEFRAVFAPLKRIQRDLGAAGRVNTILLSGVTESVATAAARSVFTLQDLGMTVRAAADGRTAITEVAGGIVSEPVESAIRTAGQKLGYTAVPIFTYLANTLRVRDREVPYSLVTATDLSLVDPSARSTSAREHASTSAREPVSTSGRDSIFLNEWAARELNARSGDPVEIEYYLWDANAGLTTHRQTFRVAGIVPIAGFAADRELVPEYPGITGAESVADWDPPFPIDLSRVKPADEKYWDDYRATPKAFISYERGRELWRTRYGAATSLRFAVPEGVTADVVASRLSDELRASVPPRSLGLAVLPVRRLALTASAGATDFGQYFTYFSFFLMVAALLLAVLFFRLGVEQRLRQIGVLRAAGFAVARIRSLLLLEAFGLSVLGGALGAAGAVAYGHLIIFGLRTWWIGAVGTSQLALHVNPVSIAAGAASGVVAGVLCVVVSLRSVARLAPRSLITAQSIGEELAAVPRTARRSRTLAILFAVAAIGAAAAGFLARQAQAGAFFGAGGAALVAALLFLSSWLRSRPSAMIAGHGIRPVLRLGFRSAASRPGRTVLSAALIASAAFIIVSVDAFRKGGGELGGDRTSGTGGYALVATSEIPLVHNPNEPAGREALTLQAPEAERATFTRFRVRPGDDASCLNLYRPSSPTIIAPEPAFIAERRFTFAASVAASDAERQNPWLLLDKRFPDGAVPVIADATSLQYVLHASVGDSFSMDIGAEQPLQLLFVGAISDSVLQGELIMSEQNFVRLFPAQQGYRFFLVEGSDVRTRDDGSHLAGVLEKALSPFGFDAVTTTERLDAYHRVENTYLSTFQSLGGLGLILGTIGLAAVMFRNVLERRRELGLLRAVGYDRRRVTQMILAEVILLLGAGLGAGVLSAVLAVLPAWFGRGGARPGVALLMLLIGVVLAGVVSSALAVRAALRGEVLNALRAE
jgi:ABC-type lipoprotein release transport system permease subunit